MGISREDFGFTTDYSILPKHMREGAKLYIERGIKPGSFMEAVICNNLTLACMYADDINRYRLFDIVNFFYNEAPSACWGSKEKMEKWIEHKIREEKGYDG